MASRMRKLFLLGGLVAMFAAGCPTQTPTSTDPTLTRSNPKRTVTPKPSGVGGPQDGGGSSSASPGTNGGSSNPSSNPSTGASNSPSPGSSASVPPVASFWVQVNDAAGNPVNGAVVEGYAADATTVLTTVTGSGTTDAKGQVAKIEAAGKALNLIATTSTDATLKGFVENVESTATGKVIKLEKVGSIKGAVKVEGATVNLENIKVFIAGTPFQATTNATGEFTITGVPVGTYTVTAESATLGKANKPGIAVSAGAEATVAADGLKLSVTAPTLTSLSLQNGGAGVEVTLTGTNFGLTGNKTFKVTFNGTEATSPTRVSDSSIMALVPTGATSGDVIVTVNDLASNGKGFKVLDHLVFDNPRTSLPLGTSHTYKVYAIDTKLDAQGKIQTIDNPHVTQWEVVEGDAFTIDQTGKVTTAKAGTAKVKAYSGSLFELASVTVTNDVVTVTSVAGSGQPTSKAATTDGAGTNAKFCGPIGLALAPGGAGILIADQYNNGDAGNGPVFNYGAIRSMTFGGTVTKLYGDVNGNGPNDITDGPVANAKFRFPSGMVFDSQGNLFVCDQGSNRIRKITTGGQIETFVGDGSGSSSDGTGTGATTSGPAYICRDQNDNLYFTEWGPTSDENQSGTAGRVRMVTPAGVVTTLAGGLNGFHDGVAGNARFTLPTGITIDAAGENLYIADFGNNVIRKLAIATKTVSTVAGVPALEGPPKAEDAGITGAPGFVDGELGVARFNAPAGLAFGQDGLLYVADDNNNAIRRVNVTTGVVNTLVGSTTAGAADGTAATASFKNPHDLVFKPGTNELYVLDYGNYKVRKIVFE